MRYAKLSLWFSGICVVLLCVSLSEAGRFRAARSDCAGGACAPVAEPLPADTEFAVRGWPWTKPPAPAPQPTPAPVPAPIVLPPAPAPAVEVVTSEISAEVRRPVVRAVAAPVRAVGALAGVICNREHKPVLRTVKAVLGRERRAARRGG